MHLDEMKMYGSNYGHSIVCIVHICGIRHRRSFNVRSSVCRYSITFTWSYCLESLLTFFCDTVSISMGLHLAQNCGKAFQNTLNMVYKTYREFFGVGTLDVKRTARNLCTGTSMGIIFSTYSLHTDVAMA